MRCLSKTACMDHLRVLSRLSSVQLFVTTWTVPHQALLSVGFSRQEYWSGLPCPPPRDLPDPGITPTSLTSLALAEGLFTTIATAWVKHISNPFPAVSALSFPDLFFSAFEFRIDFLSWGLILAQFHLHFSVYFYEKPSSPQRLEQGNKKYVF